MLASTSRGATGNSLRPDALTIRNIYVFRRYGHSDVWSRTCHYWIHIRIAGRPPKGNRNNARYFYKKRRVCV